MGQLHLDISHARQFSSGHIRHLPAERHSSWVTRYDSAANNRWQKYYLFRSSAHSLYIMTYFS